MLLSCCHSLSQGFEAVHLQKQCFWKRRHPRDRFSLTLRVPCCRGSTRRRRRGRWSTRRWQRSGWPSDRCVGWDRESRKNNMPNLKNYRSCDLNIEFIHSFSINKNYGSVVFEDNKKPNGHGPFDSKSFQCPTFSLTFSHCYVLCDRGLYIQRQIFCKDVSLSSDSPDPILWDVRKRALVSYIRRQAWHYVADF